ncbi:MAG: hypothetical protein QOI24_2213 [Acidobacteriota bacterium]|nr:hypothetical protein [Acidobacteriota bacterium]
MATATKLTYEDYVRMPDDGQRYELIDGELFVVPAPNSPHQFAILNIAAALHGYLLREGGGRVAMAPLDVILSPANVVQPDVLFVRDQNASRIEFRGVVGAPDLVVEALSNSTKRRDETVKRELYERFGVTEYWIVDPAAKTVKVLRLAGARYETVAELRDNDTLTSPQFPGLALPLATIFA